MDSKHTISDLLILANEGATLPEDSSIQDAIGGGRVHHATNLRDANTLLETNTIHCILAESRLNGESTIEWLIAWLRADDRHRAAVKVNSAEMTLHEKRHPRLKLVLSEEKLVQKALEWLGSTTPAAVPELLQRWMDSCPDGFLLINQEDLCLYANHRAFSLESDSTACPPASYPNPAVALEDLLPGFVKSFPRWKERVKEIRSGSSKQLEDFQQQDPLNEGTIWHILYEPCPVPSAEGCVGIYMHDLSGSRRGGSLELRAQRLENIGLLAGGVAHDLNNVLAPILMSVQLLQEQIQDETSKDILSMVEQSALRGAEIVRQVLTFARGMEGERIEVQLRHLIKEVIQIVQETFPKNIQVEYDLDREAGLVLGDPTKLNQVLINLAINARDAMPNGGRLFFGLAKVNLDQYTGSLVGPGAKGDYVRIEVSDTGTGISKADLDRIYEPFFTTKMPGKGTGLGLSTVLSIVKAHLGGIKVESTLGEGTSFLIFLPATRLLEPKSTVQIKSNLPRGRGETILVVDDEASIRNVCQKVLSKHGYQVLLAEDGTDGLALFAQHTDAIKLVLTDLMMPVMDGLILSKALRKLSPTIKVVVSSGMMDDNEVRHKVELLKEIHITENLRKPYTIDELLHCIHRQLQKE